MGGGQGVGGEGDIIVNSDLSLIFFYILNEQL